MFSLFPFFWESFRTKKSFVLKMEVYPKAEMLCFDVLQLTGVSKMYVPIKHMIPVTKYDYWCASH